MELYLKPGKCECGCGQQVNGKRRFLQGHDAKLKSALISTELLGEEVYVNDGGTLTSCNAIDYAAGYGFAAQVVAAVNARRAKSHAKADRKTAKVRARAGAAAIAESVKAKVGRWVYTGIVRDGAFTYRAKDGEVKHTTKFTLV